MNCTDYVERLNALIDGELSPPELAAVTGHLTACADCRSYLAELAQLRAALQQEIPEEDVPPEFQTKILALLEEAATGAASPQAVNVVPFKKRRVREGFAWVAAATAIAAMLMVTLLPRHDVTKDLMSVRDAALRAGLAQDITVRQAPAAAGFRLTAARMDLVAGHKAQVFAYAGGDKPITLCIWPANGEPAHGIREAAFKGMSIAYWNDGEAEYWAATAGPAASLDSFVAAIRKS
jgi:anti-sigma factor RsiW